MKMIACTLSLFCVASLGTLSLAAECYEGKWVAETKATREQLEIKDDGCLILKVVQKDRNGAETLYDTCYKVKTKKGHVYGVEIENKQVLTPAEITCLDQRVKFKWGEVTDRVFTHAPQ